MIGKFTSNWAAERGHIQLTMLTAIGTEKETKSWGRNESAVVFQSDETYNNHKKVLNLLLNIWPWYIHEIKIHSWN